MPITCGAVVRAGDTWHCDEVFLKINGKTHYVWRAVDQDGTVLDILVQRRRGYPAEVKARVVVNVLVPPCARSGNREA